MPYNATDQSATGANLYTADSAALGQRASYQFPVRGLDQALGGGEFVYCEFNGTVNAGDFVQLSTALLANATIQTQAVQWAGTQNLPVNLGVSLAAQVAGQFGWVQIFGLAVANTSGIVAIGQQLSFNAAGVVQGSAAVAGKQVLGATVASLNNATISGYGALGAQKALVMLNRPFAQGAIT
jgi:hypothetical protein